MTTHRKKIPAASLFITYAVMQALLVGCEQPSETWEQDPSRSLAEVVAGSIIVRSTLLDDLGSVESEIVDESDDRPLALAWHFPTDNRYDYATPLDESGRAHIRSIPMSERHSLVEYNQMLVARYLARESLPVQPYEQAAEYRRGCAVPFARENVGCDDHCANECCTSLQQCLWEVEHTGDFGGLRAVNCMHTAAMCHGTCGVCKLAGDFAAVNGGNCDVPAVPGGTGEGLTCDLGDSLAVKACSAAWDTATNLSTVTRRLKDGIASTVDIIDTRGAGRSAWDIFDTVNSLRGDLETAADLANIHSFPGSKCGCDMHPCFDTHCADRLLGELPPGLTGVEVTDRVTSVLGDAYYCARDCQLDAPDGVHACRCPSDQEWCTEGSRRCADGLPAWDEYGDVARCQVSCDAAEDSACYCRDRDRVLCLASEDCPGMADACVPDQNGDGLHDHEDCEIWRGNNCLECGSNGRQCCPGDRCLDADSACIDGTCRPCGGYGQPCCAGESCDASHLECVPDSGSPYGHQCEPIDCGYIADACCLSGQDRWCGGDARRSDGPNQGELGYITCSYYDDFSNSCIACGLEGEACCQDRGSLGDVDACAAGLTCVTNFDREIVDKGNSRGDIIPDGICKREPPPDDDDDVEPTDSGPSLPDIAVHIDNGFSCDAGQAQVSNIGTAPTGPFWIGALALGDQGARFYLCPSIAPGHSTLVGLCSLEISGPERGVIGWSILADGLEEIDELSESNNQDVCSKSL